MPMLSNMLPYRPCSTIQPVHIVLLFLIVLRDLHDLLLSQVVSAHGTSALAQQPGTHALEVVAVAAGTRQLDYQRIRVRQEVLGADGAAVVLLQRLARHAVQAVEVLLRQARDGVGRRADVRLQLLHQPPQELHVLRRRRVRPQLRELVVHHPEHRRQVHRRRPQVGPRAGR